MFSIPLVIIAIYALLFRNLSHAADPPTLNETAFNDILTYIGRFGSGDCAEDYFATTSCQAQDKECVCREIAPALGGATSPYFQCLYKVMSSYGKELLAIADAFDTVLCKDIEGICLPEEKNIKRSDSPVNLIDVVRSKHPMLSGRSSGLFPRAVDEETPSVFDSNLVPTGAKRCISNWLTFTKCTDTENVACACNEVAPRLGQMTGILMKCVITDEFNTLNTMVDFIDNILCTDVGCGEIDESPPKGDHKGPQGNGGGRSLGTRSKHDVPFLALAVTAGLLILL